MNFVEMLLNYLDFFKIIVIITVILIIFVTFLLISNDSSSSILSDESILNIFSSIIKHFDNKKKKVELKKSSNPIKPKQSKGEIKIKEFYQNEIIADSNKFILSNKEDNINYLSEKLFNNKNNINNINNKKDELAMMYIESISSLNSWKNNELENEIFKKINWNLEKREDNNEEKESLISHYVFPKYNLKSKYANSSFSNLSSSQISINSNSDTDDGEEEKENELLSKYKLGICRMFENSNENNIKSNIVKEIKGSLYKIYSEGSPNLIKEKCKKETIPDNYNEIIEKYKEMGYDVIGLSGKKMKMNYAQSQRIERIKCESNMIFLGFIIYKMNIVNYK